MSNAELSDEQLLAEIKAAQLVKDDERAKSLATTLSDRSLAGAKAKVANDPNYATFRIHRSYSTSRQPVIAPLRDVRDVAGRALERTLGSDHAGETATLVARRNDRASNLADDECASADCFHCRGTAS